MYWLLPINKWSEDVSTKFSIYYRNSRCDRAQTNKIYINSNLRTPSPLFLHSKPIKTHFFQTCTKTLCYITACSKVSWLEGHERIQGQTDEQRIIDPRQQTAPSPPGKLLPFNYAADKYTYWFLYSSSENHIIPRERRKEVYTIHRLFSYPISFHIALIRQLIKGTLNKPRNANWPTITKRSSLFTQAIVSITLPNWL